MDEQVGRLEAVAILRSGHAALDTALDGIADEDLTRPGTIGGGDWSAADLVGHIESWEQLALQHLETTASPGERSAQAGAGGQPWKGVDAFNATQVAAKAGRSPAAVRQASRTTTTRLIETISSMSDEAWQALSTGPGGDEAPLGVVLGRIMGGDDGLFRHIEAHLGDARAFAAGLDRT